MDNQPQSSIADSLKKFFFITSTPRLTQLEGLRALAILWVFNFHFLLHYQYSFEKGTFGYYFVNTFIFGFIGVDLFFILSGFLIYQALLKNNKTFFQFIKNRYVRLLPVTLLVSIPFLAHNFSLPNLVINLTFLDIYPNSKLSNVILWSLVFEIYFYITIGILFKSLPQKLTQSWGMILFLALLVFFAQFLPQNCRPAGGEIIRGMGFIFGMVISKLYTSDQLKIFRNFKKTTQLLSLLLLVVSIVYWGTLNHWSHYWVTLFSSNIFWLSFDIIFALILCCVLSDENAFAGIFNNIYARMIGIISFSFYVIHEDWGLPLGFRMAEQLLSTNNLVLIMIGKYVITLTVTIACGTFVFHYIEKSYFTNKKTDQPKPLIN